MLLETAEPFSFLSTEMYNLYIPCINTVISSTDWCTQMMNWIPVKAFISLKKRYWQTGLLREKKGVCKKEPLIQQWIRGVLVYTFEQKWTWNTQNTIYMAILIYQPLSSFSSFSVTHTHAHVHARTHTILTLFPSSNKGALCPNNRAPNQPSASMRSQSKPGWLICMCVLFPTYCMIG